MVSTRFCVVGAGITGATIARTIAENGGEVFVFEARDHVAGNCHTVWDNEADCFQHVYGPHIFHTNNQEVLDWVGRFTTILAYRHSVKITTGDRIYNLPITLHTLNQFFSRTMSPQEAKSHLAKLAIEFENPNENFETIALSMVGEELYEAFFKHYTIKQWGREPTQIPASVFSRLPIRFNYDDNYFHHSIQGLPDKGYTGMVEQMLDHPAIHTILSEKVEFWTISKDFDRVFWSGPIEEVFGADEGYLPYRTLDMVTSKIPGDYLGCAVMNYPDAGIPYTRITQHNYFRKTEDNQQPVETSLISREISREWREGDIQFYPVNLSNTNLLLENYQRRALEHNNLCLCGRLGTFRYMDMDVAISAALKLATAV